ncbi:Hypothetical predicted protein [Olea europaea subsp. europaea]|uniref:Uncharacterized protein n=1 Tax=Olea europaea subsp. europaea TaxID=158383 RepID=A0A8S0TKF0_OLEEU|nr:Hypothetical predicted protein [Olea europaea subsp. europaea]
MILARVCGFQFQRAGVMLGHARPGPARSALLCVSSRVESSRVEPCKAEPSLLCRLEGRGREGKLAKRGAEGETRNWAQLNYANSLAGPAVHPRLFARGRVCSPVARGARSIRRRRVCSVRFGSVQFGRKCFKGLEFGPEPKFETFLRNGGETQIEIKPAGRGKLAIRAKAEWEGIPRKWLARANERAIRRRALREGPPAAYRAARSHLCGLSARPGPPSPSGGKRASEQHNVARGALPSVCF